jgi:serine/threonine-protein kinase
MLALKCDHCGIEIEQSNVTLSVSDSDSDTNHNNVTDTLFRNVNTLLPNNVNEEQSIQLNPKTMGHFKITDILGKGGMGAVYKAKDLVLERFVAIKMIRLIGIEQKMLLAEAKTISKLNHPNIVTVYDISRGDDANFIVMEWINGRPLNEIIPPQGLSLNIVLEYARQMVSAITCAHQQHIIHRDIKPQNIMVDSDGHIKVLDFGISALIHPENKRKLEQPELLGTPQYMAPEQINGKPTDERSDLFSLGIVLYEMLTGSKPFLGLNIKQISHAITKGEYTPLTECKPELSTTIIECVNKLLQTDPATRYQSAEKLAQDIDAISQQISDKKNWWQRQHWITKSLIMVPIIAIMGWSFKGVIFPPTTQELIQRQLVESKKIAFLPFDNISGDPVLQLFSDAMATMLSNDLAEVGYQQGDGATWVLPTSEIRRLNDPSIENIYNKYGVDLIITGSIQHMGSTRSVNLSLINGADGRQLKSVQLSIEADKLFLAQTDIRDQVIDLIDWKIPNELVIKFAAQKPAFDGAYKHYLAGKGYLYRYDQAGNITKALTSFNKAIELDTQYENAYVGLAETQLKYFIESKENIWLDKMGETIKKLLSVNPDNNLARYLTAEIQVRKGNYQDSAEYFKLSIQHNPLHIKSYLGLANSSFLLNAYDQAESAYVDALTLSPNNTQAITNFGIHYFSIGEYDKAILQFKKLTEIAPNNDNAYLNIAAGYYSLGKIDQAIKMTLKAIALKPTASAFSNLGTMYFYQNKYLQSITAFEKAVELLPNNYMFWGNLGDAYWLVANEKYQTAYNEAATLAKRTLDLNSKDQLAIACLAYYFSGLNQQEKSLEYALQIGVNSDATSNFMVAAAFDRFNQKEKVLQHLEYSLEKKYPLEEVINSPLLPNIKNDARFGKLSN